jgi:hypothetical protein
MEDCGLDSFGLEQGPVASYCEDSNEPSASINTDNFYINWTTVKFTKINLSPWNYQSLCSLIMVAHKINLHDSAHITAPMRVLMLGSAMKET